MVNASKRGNREGTIEPPSDSGGPDAGPALSVPHLISQVDSPLHIRFAIPLGSYHADDDLQGYSWWTA